MKFEEPQIIKKEETSDALTESVPSDSWDMFKYKDSRDFLENIPKYIEKISHINKEDFVKDFFEVKKVFHYMYEEQYLRNWPNPKEETLEKIEVLEKMIYEKIKEYKLPYIYELLINKYTEIQTRTPLIGNKRYEKSVSPLEMSEPFRVSDKFGKEFFVLSYNGKVKACPLENEKEFKEYLGMAEIYGHDYITGIKDVYSRYFTESVDFNSLGLNPKDAPTYATFLSDDCQEIIEDLFKKPIKKKEAKYSSNIIDKNREGFYFTNFFLHADKYNFLKLKNFSEKYSFNGLRTFLSVEHGGKEMGDKILTLAEKLPEDLAKKLFSKYSEYIDSVNTVEDFIKENFSKSDEVNDLIPKTKEAMFLRGYQLLRSQADKIEKNEFNEESFNSSVEQAKTNIDMFKNMFRIAREHDKNTSFEDFSNLNPEEIDSNELNKEDEIQIEEIIKKNYENPELQNQVLESFKNSLKNGTKLNLLRTGKTIIATSRLDAKNEDTLYFGSFNVDSDYCGSKIGDAFFQATIMPHMKEKIIEADCSTISPIGAYYIEAGFVGESFYSKGGEPSMSILSKPDANFNSKKLSKEEIMNLKENDMIKVFKGESQQDLPVEMFEQGKKLTRYFYDKNTKLWYFAFE